MSDFWWAFSGGFSIGGALMYWFMRWDQGR